MNLSEHLAKHLREVYFGGNWTDVSLKEHVADLSWQQATTQVQSFNTIAKLVFHMNYYVSAALKVFRGGALDASDKYSFDLPPIQSEADWQSLLEKTWSEARLLAELVEQMPEQQLKEPFADGKYGNNFRNIEGVIEHVHYHLGQLVMLKKMIVAAV
ncbi:MAG TPA: DUF1572 domain-containing protein [Panacibacter sp.]|nr:DUF1572 domain-containing protein [Panacibacter sp.]HNP46015.1 DUF1572 domain-containing protein [Panacibacter sp.]